MSTSREEFEKAPDEARLLQKLISAESASFLTQGRLKELFIYDEVTGNFTRKRQQSSNSPIGTIAGSKSHGYLIINVDGRKYRSHRLAWLYVHGSFPAGFIDHVNGQRDDNRIANLRIVSVTGNRENQRTARRDSRTGVLGVQWSERKHTYIARIKVKGRFTYLGSFSDLEMARTAYIEAKRKVHKTCSI